MTRNLPGLVLLLMLAGLTQPSRVGAAESAQLDLANFCFADHYYGPVKETPAFFPGELMIFRCDVQPPDREVKQVKLACALQLTDQNGQTQLLRTSEGQCWLVPGLDKSSR